MPEYQLHPGQMGNSSFLRAGEMKTMKTSHVRPKLYEVWRLAFEYEDIPGVSKERPVIVGAFDEERALVLVVKVTGHGVRPGFPGEVPIIEWKQAGLDKPSTAR